MIFVEWLEQQKGRDDDVGSIARAWDFDKPVPSDMPVGDLAQMIRSVWNASEEVVGYLQKAWGEWATSQPEPEQPPEGFGETGKTAWTFVVQGKIAKEHFDDLVDLLAAQRRAGRAEVIESKVHDDLIRLAIAAVESGQQSNEAISTAIVTVLGLHKFAMEILDGTDNPRID